MNPKSTLYIFIFSLFSSIVYSQTTIKEKDYSVTYYPNSIEISFDKSVTFSAFDSKSYTEKHFIADSNKANTYILSDFII